MISRMTHGTAKNIKHVNGMELIFRRMQLFTVRAERERELLFRKGRW